MSVWGKKTKKNLSTGQRKQMLNTFLAVLLFALAANETRFNLNTFDVFTLFNLSKKKNNKKNNDFETVGSQSTNHKQSLLLWRLLSESCQIFICRGGCMISLYFTRSSNCLRLFFFFFFFIFYSHCFDWESPTGRITLSAFKGHSYYYYYY